MALIKCKECGREVSDQAKSCPNCGAPLTLQTGFTDVAAYYQDEFVKITESNETYKGKWNWWAFIFGAFLALSKGLWLSALLCFIVGIVTSGIGFVVYWFIYGSRGTYMYYAQHTKGKQLPF